MTKELMVSFKYNVLQPPKNTIIFLIPEEHLTYPEPSTTSG